MKIRQFLDVLSLTAYYFALLPISSLTPSVVVQICRQQNKCVAKDNVNVKIKFKEFNTILTNYLL